MGVFIFKILTREHVSNKTEMLKGHFRVSQKSDQSFISSRWNALKTAEFCQASKVLILTFKALGCLRSGGLKDHMHLPKNWDPSDSYLGKHLFSGGALLMKRSPQEALPGSLCTKKTTTNVIRSKICIAQSQRRSILWKINNTYGAANYPFPAGLLCHCNLSYRQPRNRSHRDLIAPVGSPSAVSFAEPQGPDWNEVGNFTKPGSLRKFCQGV